MFSRPSMFPSVTGYRSPPQPATVPSTARPPSPPPTPLSPPCGAQGQAPGPKISASLSRLGSSSFRLGQFCAADITQCHERGAEDNGALCPPGAGGQTSGIQVRTGPRALRGCREGSLLVSSRLWRLLLPPSCWLRLPEGLLPLWFCVPSSSQKDTVTALGTHPKPGMFHFQTLN